MEEDKMETDYLRGWVFSKATSALERLGTVEALLAGGAELEVVLRALEGVRAQVGDLRAGLPIAPAQGRDDLTPEKPRRFNEAAGIALHIIESPL